MRGKVAGGQIYPVRGRITPACAGKRRPFKFSNEMEEDHPRVCGEKLIVKVDALADEGSPPRVRGKD